MVLTVFGCLGCWLSYMWWSQLST